MNYLKIFLLFALAWSSVAVSTELMPWFSDDYVIQLQAKYGYQVYHHLNLDHHEVSYSSTNTFVGASAGMTYDTVYNGEIEIYGADTRQHDLNLDYGRFTGRYLIWDDVAAIDPISLTVGLSTTLVPRNALIDYSLGHHGEVEFLTHAAIGKEFSCESFWTSRWWAVTSLGFANRGAPWSTFHIAWETNLWGWHQWRFYSHMAYGWGTRSFTLFDTFKGYGSIRYRSVDLGIRYSILTTLFATLSVEYCYRLYALNYPSHVNTFQIIWDYPFGL